MTKYRVVADGINWPGDDGEQRAEHGDEVDLSDKVAKSLGDAVERVHPKKKGD